MKAAPKLKRQKKLFTKRKRKNLPRPSHMRIDVTLWYPLITKDVTTPNCYDGNSTISSTVPTSPTPSHYALYDVNQSDGVRSTEPGAFIPSSPSYPHYDEVNINRLIIARGVFDLI